jgi:hypothetical protein
MENLPINAETLIKLGKESAASRLDEVLNVFPAYESHRLSARSAIYQPERISLNSKDNAYINLVFNDSTEVGIGYASNYYNSFSIKLERPLKNVKSLQLLTAVIPPAQTSLPPSEVFFRYYRLRDISGSYTNWAVANYTQYQIVKYLGNYYFFTYNLTNRNAWVGNGIYNVDDFVSYLGAVYLCIQAVGPVAAAPPAVPPTYVLPPNDSTHWVQINSPAGSNPVANPLLWTLIGASPARDKDPNFFDMTNAASVPITAGLGYVEIQNLPSLVNDTIAPSDVLNKIFPDYDSLVATLSQCAADPDLTNWVDDVVFGVDPFTNRVTVKGTGAYYYLPLGLYDPWWVYLDDVRPSSTLNTRLGFTWNGSIPGFSNRTFSRGFNPYVNDAVFNATEPQLFYSKEGIQGIAYANLVYTPSIHIYCDIVGGSTEDSEGNGGLLSVVPTYAQQYGVSQYQNNFSRPLTKIPGDITQITVILKTDTGEPYYVPYGANTTLELAADYLT